MKASSVRSLLAFLFLPLSLFCLTPYASGQIFISNSDNGNVDKAGKLDPVATKERVASFISRPRGIAVDESSGGTVYYVIEQSGRVGRSTFGGVALSDVISGLSFPNTSFDEALNGLAYDSANNQLFVTALNGANYALFRFDVGNAGTLSLVEEGGTDGGPTDVEVDSGAGKVYWLDSRDGSIHRSDLNGSNQQLVRAGNGNQIGGIGTDTTNGRIYWSNKTLGRIQSSNFDGSNVNADVFPASGGGDPLSVGDGVEVDHGLNPPVVYWGDRDNSSVQRGALGSGVETLLTVANGLAGPIDIALSQSAPLPTPDPVPTPTPCPDSDQDGTTDCDDGCPNDPGKTGSGVCGCGTPDADTDSDGTLDCNDRCPADATKIVEGRCGCGVAELDSNRDGFIDCGEAPRSVTPDSVLSDAPIAGEPKKVKKKRGGKKRKGGGLSLIIFMPPHGIPSLEAQSLVSRAKKSRKLALRYLLEVSVRSASGATKTRTFSTKKNSKKITGLKPLDILTFRYRLQFKRGRKTLDTTEFSPSSLITLPDAQE